MMDLSRFMMSIAADKTSARSSLGSSSLMVPSLAQVGLRIRARKIGLYVSGFGDGDIRSKGEFGGLDVELDTIAGKKIDVSV